MEVKISFDTEKESIEDLKKLVAALQDLIAKKEKLPNNTSIVQSYQKVEINKPKEEVMTRGGGRVIPYEDMSDSLSRIMSGRKP